MNRPLFAWSVFGICLLATTSAVGWLTHSAWRADLARQQALQDSELRNALWRLDSLAAPLLAVEINRPSFSAPFHNTPMLASKLIQGYVVRDATGRWTIRRTGSSNQTESLTADCPLVCEDWTARLGSDAVASTEPATSEANPARIPEELVIWPDAVLLAQGQMRNSISNNFTGPEAQSRNQFVQQVQQFQHVAANTSIENASTAYHVNPPQPVWVGEELVFARRVSIPNRPDATTIELVWLNWKEWQRLLAAQLAELTIPVELRPSDPSQIIEGLSSNDWQMVSLPIRLEPKPNQLTGTWPVPLIAVWGLLLLVALAFGWLMHQTLNLSERRAAFVSAVTHELRTPLTTFRLYTEMLSEGLAREPEQQQIYFQTLNREANRLTHLVENVLAFARLEHGRSTARNETLAVADLCDRIGPRLEQRVAESNLTLSVAISEPVGSARLTTNAMAVEQILFNLIDNSCKYARDAVDPRITFDVGVERDHVYFRVADFGPGLSRSARRSLFRPFQKSSLQAAESASGIGLGLALSHRLARDLRGSLRCCPSTHSGLCFELQLPLG